VRRLLPWPPADTVDLDEAYWVDDPGRQHVRGVMIASVDGAAQLAGRAGGLAGPADVQLFALLRRHADVLLVGAGTARAEGYGGHRLTPAERRWRRDHGLTDVPPIAVVTRTCALDPLGPLFTQTDVRPIVLTCQAAPPAAAAALEQRADVISVGADAVDMADALDTLAQRGLRRVSCEGGPTVLAEVLAAGRLDELSLTVSPLMLAGPALRITQGPVVDPPLDLRLAQVLEQDGFVFLRYDVANLGGEQRQQVPA
jgi:riboflavin biosynthesis pyrimidine reductase